jgi:hypothetical protein
MATGTLKRSASMRSLQRDPGCLGKDGGCIRGPYRSCASLVDVAGRHFVVAWLVTVSPTSHIRILMDTRLIDETSRPALDAKSSRILRKSGVPLYPTGGTPRSARIGSKRN